MGTASSGGGDSRESGWDVGKLEPDLHLSLHTALGREIVRDKLKAMVV